MPSQIGDQLDVDLLLSKGPGEFGQDLRFDFSTEIGQDEEISVEPFPDIPFGEDAEIEVEV